MPKINPSTIKWDEIDEEKSKFIYGEAVAHLDSIHNNDEFITSKAIGILSFSLPILAALTGFFVVQWEKLSTPLSAMSICAGILLLIIMVLLVAILAPKKTQFSHEEPSVYFADGYYLKSKNAIFKENILYLQKCINKDGKIQRSRARLLRVAVVLFAFFPFISVVVWAVTLYCFKA